LRVLRLLGKAPVLESSLFYWNKSHVGFEHRIVPAKSMSITCVNPVANEAMRYTA
jgi:hypothetical protein